MTEGVTRSPIEVTGQIGEQSPAGELQRIVGTPIHHPMLGAGAQ